MFYFKKVIDTLSTIPGGPYIWLWNSGGKKLDFGRVPNKICDQLGTATAKTKLLYKKTQIYHACNKVVVCHHKNKKMLTSALFITMFLGYSGEPNDQTKVLIFL